ncbi:6399_t:CDS:2, partial [Funneliformis geosporum]
LISRKLTHNFHEWMRVISPEIMADQSSLKASQYSFCIFFFSKWSSPMLASHSLISSNLFLASSKFCNASEDGFRKAFQHSVASLYSLRSPDAIIISAGADKSSWMVNALR